MTHKLEKEFWILQEKLVQLSQPRTAPALPHEELGTLLKRYTELLLVNEKHSDKYFDSFLESNVMQGLSVLRGKYASRVTDAAVIDCLAMLVINLGKPLDLAYLLCQPALLEVVNLALPPSEEDELEDSYVSFLKSLAQRLTPENLALFFNRNQPWCPLLRKITHFFNHPNGMIRTSVLNVLLGLIRSAPLTSPQPPARAVFLAFPISDFLP